MEHPPEPIPMPSRPRRSTTVETGERWGRELGNWAQHAREWKKDARRQMEELQHFWEEVKEPESRARHIWTLMAIAAGTGFIVGLALRRPKS